MLKEINESIRINLKPNTYEKGGFKFSMSELVLTLFCSEFVDQNM